MFMDRSALFLLRSPNRSMRRQRQRWVGVDGLGGATTSPPRGCPRTACSSPVRPHWRARGATRGSASCAHPRGSSCLPSAPLRPRLRIPLRLPATQLGQRSDLHPRRAGSPEAAMGNAVQYGAREAGGGAPSRARGATPSPEPGQEGGGRRHYLAGQLACQRLAEPGARHPRGLLATREYKKSRMVSARLFAQLLLGWHLSPSLCP